VLCLISTSGRTGTSPYRWSLCDIRDSRSFASRPDEKEN